MEKHEEFKSSSRERLNKLRADFEALKSEARHAQDDRKTEIEENLEKLQKLHDELESKHDRVEHFGDIALQELSDSFFSSAKAFQDIVEKTKDKLKK